MWPWQTNGSNHAPMTEPQLSDSMRRRLDELNERQDRFERVVKELRLEWDEMYDKMRLLLARLSKRVKDAARAEGDSPQSLQDAPESTNPRAVAYDRPAALRGGPKGRGNY